MPSRRLLSVFATVLAGATFVHAADNDQELSQQYLSLYTQVNDADEAERHENYPAALKIFQDCYAGFSKIHDANPDWETAIVLHRMNDCHAKVLYLQTVSAGLPPAKMPPMDISRPQSNSYPWKKDISATLFWIGESPASAWNKNWTQSNGGPDAPGDRDEAAPNGYGPAHHAFKENPFYVALPFNDLAFPDKAKKWLPAGWARTGSDGQPISACQNHWVEIKQTGSYVCYAQWEDVGPGHADDAEYVFGNQAPRAHDGICISPAVSDYLDVKGGAPLNWRFVDAGDVQPGAWLKYDEEAVLFRALHSLGPQKGPLTL